MSLIKRTAGTTKPRVAGRTATPARGTATSKFQYRSRTPEQVRERAQRAIGGRDSYFSQDIQFFTPRVGDNNVRILPPPPDADWRAYNSPAATEPGPYHYGVNLAVHYSIGADESAYLCLTKMKGEDCPLCEERNRATSAGEEELADALRAGSRVAVYVIDRAQESKGPMLWNLPAGLDKDITKLCIDPGTGEVLPIDDPVDGYDLSFTREGEGLKTKYKGVQFSRKPSPLADDEETMEAWLAHITEHAIDKCLIYFDADHIAKVYEGQAPPTTDEETEKPAKPGKAGKPGRRGAPADPAPEKERPKIAVRGKKKEEPPAEEEPPTWEELEAMDEDELAALGEAAEIDFPEEGFDDLDALRAFIAEALGVTEPEPEPEKTKGGGGWREKLAKLKSKK